MATPTDSTCSMARQRRYHQPVKARLLGHARHDDVGVSEITWTRLGYARFRCRASSKGVYRRARRGVTRVGPDEPGVRVVADERVVVTLELGAQRIRAGSIRIGARRADLERCAECTALDRLRNVAVIPDDSGTWFRAGRDGVECLACHGD